MKALDGVDMSVGGGEVLAVLGPNGAGKSTALALLLGLQRPDDGAVALFGCSPFDLAARRGVGVMMQDTYLPQELKVRELVAMTSAYYPRPHTTAETIALAGIDRLAASSYRSLSGGQRRQTQFALAICGRPSLLILDEPTTGVDAAAREHIWATLHGFVVGGGSIVLTTHYIEEAEALADRILLLDHGRVVAEGAVADIRATVTHKRIECRTTLALEAAQAWPEVIDAGRVGDSLRIVTSEAEAVVRRLLAADPCITGLEVGRTGLSEALAELIRRHG